MSERRRSAHGRLAARLALARAALLWEKAWPACWPVLAVLATWLILAFFDLLPLLPGVVHAAVLIGLAGALLMAVDRARRAFAIPDDAAARRRIERASGLAHRPLQALADQPGGLVDAPAARLWEAHRRRMAAAARHLRTGFPAAGLARRDPWGLRSVLAILLLLAVIDAGGDWRDRLGRALMPSLAFGTAAVAPGLDIWVAPPEYTGLPPVFLKPGAAETFRVPAGSKLLAQIHGGSSLPYLSIDEQRRDFTAVDKDNFQISETLGKGTRLSVGQGGATLGSWSIAITPDLPPTVSFAKPPEATPRAALRIDYQASDDYGVEAVKLLIRRPDGKSAETLELPLQLPGLHLKEAKSTSYHDLTPHPWAGLPVELRLVAADAIGQTGESQPVRMVLPQRTFHNPVARAIIDQRKELAKDPNSRVAVAEILGDLREQQPLYHGDAVVFLGLRIAQERLRLNQTTKSVAEVEQLLWDTALRIEDGSMSFAERDLRRLQQELQAALAQNKPDPEIDRLIRELQQAMDRYLRSLADNMANQAEQAPPPPEGARVITRRDLQRLLDQARELARSGNRDAARQLLSQLQEMLENLRTAQGMPQQGRGQAQQMMNAMRDLMRRQQKLLDRSFRADQQQQDRRGQMGQPRDPGQNPGSAGDMGDAAEQQEGLRHALGDMMRRLGEQTDSIPDTFGRAERAMREATQALQHRQPGEAIGPQTEALDQLQQAAREFAQQLQRQLGVTRGNDRAGDGQSPDRLDRDPLGRPLSDNGAFDDGDVKIPDHNTLERARAILDELRRRAGERYRPEIEREYIDRLLRQF